MKKKESAIAPYTIDVPEPILNDLHRRLENTRWSQSPKLGWDGGMDVSYLRECCDYWRAGTWNLRRVRTPAGEAWRFPF